MCFIQGQFNFKIISLFNFDFIHYKEVYFLKYDTLIFYIETIDVKYDLCKSSLNIYRQLILYPTGGIT